MSVRIHPTAIVEPGVELGAGSAVWDSVHIRGPSRIGRNCIIGEKTYIAPGVEIGDRVKVAAMVYICTAVTIETGVMIAAGTIFTNDMFPRATTSDLGALLSSAPNEETRPTLVREGATIGAGAVIGCGLAIGRFAMAGMGSVVTRSVPDFHLVVGNPARAIAYVCRCGKPLHRFQGAPPSLEKLVCSVCGLSYRVDEGNVVEIAPPALPGMMDAHPAA